MSLLNQVENRNQNSVPVVRMNIQGTDGVGKSTFGAGAESPIFIQAEDGLSYIDVPRFPLCNTWNEILDCVESVANEQHSYKTVVLDTTDRASSLCQQHACEQNGWKSIETPGFGKGFTAEKEYWQKLLDGFDFCIRKGINVILLSHVQEKTFNDPEREPYDRWTMRCPKGVNALIKDWVDFNFFASYETNTVKEGSNKARAVSFGNRALFTKFAAAYDAKSRIELPDKIDFNWQSFYTHYTQALSAKGATQTQQVKEATV
tara:strand:- start:174 stop:956 length:783 start_codon:yes stop_codon:yes gene_type:complete